MDVEINSIVGRKSYHCDILFRVIDIREHGNQKIAILYGEEYRLIADAPFQDLVKVGREERSKILQGFRSLEEQSFELFKQDIQLLKEKREYEATNGYNESLSYFQLPGKVLHIDGDPNYLKKCLSLYEKIGVTVYGAHCYEKEMPYKIGPLLEKYQPNILVVTGHDAYLKSVGKKTDLSAYRHSKSFVKTVVEARKKVPSLDQLVIFAGACQSHFESLIQAGANFASSPLRVNIHALDPVYIVAKICYTSFMEQVNVWDVIRNTLTGQKGLGGIETKGVLRTGMPYKPVEEE